MAPRRTPPPPLDGLPAVVRGFLNPKVSRPGPGRRLRRHGVGSPRGMKAQGPRPRYGAFRAHGPGYVHIDVKYLPRMKDGTARRHPLVAVDRAARWVSVRVFPAKSAAGARRFPRDPERACPPEIRTVPTDSGKGLTDRPSGLRERAATGKHGFDQPCAGPDTGHRPTPPRSPRTDGMAGRFNGRVEDVLRGHRFQSGEDPGRTLPRCVRLHNQQPPRSVPGSETPLRAIKHRHRPRPEPFRKNPYQLAGCDKGAVPGLRGLGPRGWWRKEHPCGKLRKGHLRVATSRLANPRPKDVEVPRRLALKLADRAEASRAEMDGMPGIPGSGDGIRGFIGHVRHRAGLTGRRIAGGGTVPHSGKVHSILKPHTRWISKGKAGVPVEPGVPVRVPGTGTVPSYGRGATWTWRSPWAGRRGPGSPTCRW